MSILSKLNNYLLHTHLSLLINLRKHEHLEQVELNQVAQGAQR